ncbi:HNH endonuclease [Blautia marasmi]|uniref:HNH endonuclease n=2 Tax=Blautia TaxID=572511 RepID=UPI00384653B5|nr:HNH endonuclease [Blautia marasmi]
MKPHTTKRNKNFYITDGDITYLMLKNHRFAIVNTADVELIKAYTWCIEGTGYVMSRTMGNAVKLHRIIMSANKDEFVDHIDGDPLNNVRSNLRICRKQQNEFNQKIRCDNTSGYKGVSLIKKTGKYRAYINKDGKRIELGVYPNAELAAKVYNQKARELFGEYARINSIGRD